MIVIYTWIRILQELNILKI